MFKKLHNCAVRCPILENNASPEAAIARFKSAQKARALIAVDRHKRPVGVHLASDPGKCRRDVAILDKGLTQKEHLATLSAVPSSSLEAGAIITYADRLQGWVPPEVLSSWLAKMAQYALNEAQMRENAVREVQEQSVMFLANMSHELRTPLNAIIGYADLMREETFGAVRPSQYGQYIDSIHMSGQHLLNSINAVLNLARVDAGVVHLDEQRCCLRALIGEIIDMVRTQADVLQVDVLSAVPDGFPFVLCDPQLLRQALLNLVSNAIKFSPPGAKVRVKAARTARGGVRLTVSDRGPGIPEAELGTILEPFRQASHGPGRSGVGTGLGLSLTKAFIELHEGRLHLLSEEGQGTRAILTLPSGRVLDEQNGFQKGFAFVRADVMPQKQTA